jgi:hypothetical protein
MKTILKIASVLTWFNIVFWGMIVALGLLGGFLLGQMAYVVGLVLLSAIPLNCYAALKLHTSIRYPVVPLSHQTPVGIRFVGLMALFFGITNIVTGFSVIANPTPMLDSMKEMVAQMPADVRGFYSLKKVYVVIGGAALLILGLLVAINVVLNLRLLRWYYLVHKSDAS